MRELVCTITGREYPFERLEEFADNGEAEDEILEAQRVFAQDGWFVDPATATMLCAVRKLRAASRIAADESVVLRLTDAGLKDLGALRHQPFNLIQCSLDNLQRDVEHAFK